jgi:transcriptional regulator with XRE-family HTH domain
MRDARGWTQSVLAQKLGTTQNAISRLENPRTGKPTVTTLKRIAEVFDVALVVKFAPFSEFVDSISEMSEKSVSVPSYDTEAAEQKTGATNWTGAWPWQPITLSELNGAYAEEDWTSPMSAYALPFAGQSNIIDIDVARRLYNIDKYRKPMESIGINQDFYAKRA